MSRTTRTTILALLLFAVPTSALEAPPAPAPKIATGGWAETLKEHPRLLGSRTVLASLAQYFRGSELSRYVAAQKRKGSNLAARLMDFLYEEAAGSPADLNTLPLAHLAAGIGKVYARSDWTDDATWFRFECGDFWNHHQHFETGNFDIFRHEPLATESGEYTDYLSSHSVNWLIRTVAHNGILVHQPDEKWTNLRDGGRNKYANDGGQAKKWDSHD